MIFTASPYAQKIAAEEAVLVRRFQTGDEHAYTEIFLRYKPRMYATAFSILKNRPDAEDVTQDALVYSYSALKSFRLECSLATWMHCIVRTRSLNRRAHNLRRKRAHHQSFDEPVGDDSNSLVLHEVLPDRAHGVRTQIADRELKRTLMLVINTELDDPHRRVMRLRFISNLSYEEIARRTNSCVGSVKSRLSRARANLRSLAAEKLDHTI